MASSGRSHVKKGKKHELQDPMKESSQNFRKMHKMLERNPIHGLAGTQQQRYQQIKMHVEKIRRQQQDIFLDQFKQFPKMEQGDTGENYSSIWESFEDKDKATGSLVRKLGELTSFIDEVNNLSGE